MPEYCYKCEKCGQSFSVIKTMAKAASPEKCEHCKSKKTHRDFKAEQGVGFIPKTLGHFMDLNNDRLSEDEKERIRNKNYDE